MRFIADLHIHSKYSRATSKDMDVDHLDEWARIKGIKVLGTGDFTHPVWFKELKQRLEPTERGLFKLKKSNLSKSGTDWLPRVSGAPDQAPRFLLTSEISCIYSKNNRTRKIHILVLAPEFEIVEKINAQLGWIGNLKSDGRPILGLDAKELAKIILNISPECLIVPCHMWTPWFSLFGANSGFDSIEECFEDYAKYIYAGETGLSSDPEMNWRLSQLDKIALISNSDAHSPKNIGREANVFDTDLSYQGIVAAIKGKDNKRFLRTIEFFPHEGKYHYDGHRKCGACLTPGESKKLKNICPVCGKPLTVGVLHRVDELADRKEGQTPENVIPFKKMIPLREIIADGKGVGVATKAVEEDYKKMIESFGSEFEVLLEADVGDIKQVSAEAAEGIRRVRQGQVHIEPGYDGEYGKIRIFKEEERGDFSNQASLF